MRPRDKAFALLPRSADDAAAKEPMLDNADVKDDMDLPSPGWHGELRSARRLKRRFACLLAASVCVSLVLAGLLFSTLPSAGSWWSASAESAARHAVVTSLYNDGYVNGTLALGHSLTQHSSRPLDKVVLTIPGRLGSASVCRLKAAGWTLWEVERIPPPKGDDSVYPNFKDQFTKLRVWQMEQYEHVLYVDSDCLITGEMDSIFDLPVDFAAVPDVFEGVDLKAGFNAGVLYLRPNATLFERFSHLIGELDYPAAWAEQGFLNAYYKYSAYRLPYVWNANLATKWWASEWAALLRDTRIIHFTLSKPMVPGKALDRFKAENALWTTAWKRFMTERADVFEGCPAS